LPSFDQIVKWVEAHEAELWAIGAASIGMLILCMMVVPVIVARIPADYFTHPERPDSRLKQQHQIIRLAALIGKNILGYVFIVAGLMMLLLPGQGLLTILIGILMIDFPGKYRFEKWLIHRRTVRRSINWLRRRTGRSPLQSE